MLTKTEHLLVCLSEECGEVSQAANKALRFGLNTKFGERPTTSLDDITQELIDVTAIAELLYEMKVLKPQPDYRKRVEAKKAKLGKMMEYSQKQKMLKK